MIVEKLIAFLQRCNPRAEVLLLQDELTSEVDFVEHQLTSNSVLLLTEEPNWKQSGEDDDIEITLVKRETFFAETTWKDI